jgi:DNA polymerase bacteriophage-type
MSSKLYIDFETFSKVDLKKYGGYKYATDPSTSIICLGYAFDDEPVQLWFPALPFPNKIITHIVEQGLVYAHNIIFDHRIWNYVLTEWQDVPALTYTQEVDTMALCLTYNLPASLKEAGAALNIPLQKLDTGSWLVSYLCTPDKSGRQLPYAKHKQKYDELFEYCKRDVEAMRLIVKALPRQELIPIEHHIWVLTNTMNDYGLPVDVQSIILINKCIKRHMASLEPELIRLTGGAVSAVSQFKRLTEWCKSQGVYLPNLTQETVTKALTQELPINVRTILEYRQNSGRTSVAKYAKLLDLQSDGIVRDNLQYHGAGPGRWSGRGFQMHNLPRAKIPHPEMVLQTMHTENRLDDPITTSKALIRSMILAPPHHTLIVSDYNSIENRLLAYLAGDTVTLNGFANNFDQYKDMAAYLYNVPYNNVTSDQRQMGKVIILGAGYMMGAARFVETAASWGMTIDLETAKQAIKAYREKYHMIKLLWEMLKSAAHEAVITGNRTTYKHITFGTFTINNHKWLAMQLPSGKAIYYKNPTIEPHLIPGFESMGPVDTLIHEGIVPYTRKWGRVKLTAGRITENATQGTAREVMAYGILNIKRLLPMIQLIGTVHDEAIGVVPDTYATPELLNNFNKYLCTNDWLQCELTAEGYFSKRYKKA